MLYESSQTTFTIFKNVEYFQVIIFNPKVSGVWYLNLTYTLPNKEQHIAH